MAINAEQNQQQNQQNQNQQNQQNQQPITGGGSTASSPSQGRTASFSSGAQQGTSGSGRFTNLNKYLNANQGAGSRMASGIESRINQTNEPKKTEAETSASAVRSGIESSKQDLSKGQGLQSQLSGYVNPQANSQPPAQSLQDFASQNLNDVTRFRQGVDTSNLSNQLSNAQTANVNYQNQLAERQKQLGSDTGRFGLLSETYGGKNRPTYGAGAQQLDNLFLQAGSQGKLDALNRSLIQQQQANQAQLGALQGTSATDLSNLQTGYKGLASDLTNTLATGQQNQVAAAEARAEEVNKTREDQQNYLKEQFENLRTGGQVDTGFLNMMGIDPTQALMNINKDPNFNVSNYIKMNATNLIGANQLANAQQRADYNALANLAGTDQTSRLIQQGYTPEAAYQMTENNLGKQINEANQSFLSNLGAGKYTGQSYLNKRVNFADNVEGAGNITANQSIVDALRQNRDANAIVGQVGTTSTGSEATRAQDINELRYNAAQSLLSQLSGMGALDMLNTGKGYNSQRFNALFGTPQDLQNLESGKTFSVT